MWKIESKKRSRRGRTSGESFQVWSSKKREKKRGWEKCVMAEVKTKGLSSLRNTRYYIYKHHQQQNQSSVHFYAIYLTRASGRRGSLGTQQQHMIIYHIISCVCVCVYCIAITLRFLRKRTKKISSRWPILFSLDAATDGSWSPLMFNDVKQKPRLIVDTFIFSI